MKIQITKLSELATLPQQMRKHDAAFDLYSTNEYTLQPWERRLFKTNIAMAIPEWRYGRIAPRSWLAYKHGIDILGGVIDAAYRGDIGVILLNTGKESFTVEQWFRIAQMIIEKCAQPTREVVETLETSERGEKWFGSTGYK
jgi:dUTP pyrophosphatase